MVLDHQPLHYVNTAWGSKSKVCGLESVYQRKNIDLNRRAHLVGLGFDDGFRSSTVNGRKGGDVDREGRQQIAGGGSGIFLKNTIDGLLGFEPRTFCLYIH